MWSIEKMWSQRCDEVRYRDIINVWTMSPMHYPKFSMSTLQIWVIKSGVLKNSFILCEHGTKSNIRGAKMANNRHAVNRNFLHSYWTSDGLSLYSSQPACEKTHQTQHREMLAKIQKTTCNAWRKGTASLGQMDANRYQPCSENTMVTKWTSVNKNSGKPFEISRTEVKEIN